jgi:UDP-N-acetylmuramoyl-L-alanyl-D-glutamate--2,6-diaminopimelate ligase
MIKNPKVRSVLLDEIEHTLLSLVERTANLAADTRLIVPGDVFLAYPVGFGKGLSDNRLHIPTAIDKGASLVLYDSENWPEDKWLEARSKLGDPRCIAVPQLGQLASEIASRWYADPSKDLEIYAVTGTNGKTTTAHWLTQMLGKLQSTAFVGTLGYGRIEDLQSTGYTTPDAPRVQRMLAELRDKKFKAVAMEVSSHALDQGRVEAVSIHTAIFTNLSQDHLDYHVDMAAYEAAKYSLFERSELRNIILNIDDPTGITWCRKLIGKTRAAITVYGTAESFAKLTLSEQSSVASVLYEHKANHRAGMVVKVAYQAQEFTVLVPSIGNFNLQNAMAVICVLLLNKLPDEKIVKAIEHLKPVPGRMEMINPSDKSKPLAVVDFAHTPDGLEKALNVLAPLAKNRAGNLICVFGCGGNRDRGKRPIMGKISAQIANKVIVTSDNPRNENTHQIIDQITSRNSIGISIEGNSS